MPFVPDGQAPAVPAKSKFVPDAAPVSTPPAAAAPAQPPGFFDRANSFMHDHVTDPLLAVPDLAATALTGTAGAVAGNVAGLGALALDAGSSVIRGTKPGDVADPEAVKNSVAGAMTWRPKTDTGQGVMNDMGRVGEYAGDNIRRTAGMVSEATGVDPIVAEAPFNAMKGIVEWGAGARAVPKPELPTAIPGAAEATAEALTRPRQARTPGEIADAANFKIRPSDKVAAGEDVGRMAKIGEAVGGGSAMRRDYALHNLDAVESHVVDELGLPPGTALDDAALAQVEAPHKAAYEAVEAIPKVSFDAQMANDLGKIAGDNPLTDVPPAVRQVQVEILRNTGASGKNIRQKISDLRQQARDNLATPPGQQAGARDRLLGQAQIRAANALDDLLERNVAPDQIAAYKDARRAFAITNLVRRARTRGERIDPQELVAEASTNKAMEGRLKLIADQAARYPDVFTANPPAEAAGLLPAAARMGSAVMTGAAGGGALFGLPGAVGGAVGGIVAPSIIRRSMGRTNPVADITQSAPEYFPNNWRSRHDSPMGPNDGPAVPQVPMPPNGGPPAPLSLASEPPPGFFDGNPRISNPAARPLQLLDPEGTINPPFQLEGAGPPIGPVGQLSPDVLPWQDPGTVPPLRGPSSGFADQLGVVPERPALNAPGTNFPDPLEIQPEGLSQVASPDVPPDFAELLGPQGPFPDYVNATDLSQIARELGLGDTAELPPAARPDTPVGVAQPSFMDQLSLAPDNGPARSRIDVTEDLPSQGTERFPDRYKRPEAKRVETEDGYISYIDKGDNWQIDDAFVKEAARGKGKGQAQLLDLAQEAETAGKKLNSDAKVSADQRRVYQKLKDTGKIIFDGPHAEGPVFTNIRPASEQALFERYGGKGKHDAMRGSIEDAITQLNTDARASLPPKKFAPNFEARKPTGMQTFGPRKPKE